jgi:polysaccharide biosynthesis protein PslH
VGANAHLKNIEALSMRILFLSDWFPVPVDNGSKLRIYNLLRGLAEKHEVTLLSFSENKDANPDHPDLLSICQDIKIIPKKTFNPRNHKDLSGFFSSKPRLIRDTFSPEMAQSIKEHVSITNFDLVIASQLGTASYRQFFRNIPAIFEEVEIRTFYEKFRHARTVKGKIRDGLTWFKHRQYLAGLAQDFEACTVVSEKERALVSQTIPNLRRVEVIPNFIDFDHYSEVQVCPQPKTLIFTGSFRYLPNYDAMVWFIRKVFPRLQECIPDVQLFITGDHGDLPLPEARNVTLTGFVRDIRPLLASAWVSIVPLREGGGTRLKILEAMALGVPVVSTSKGTEGLDLIEGKHFLMGDSAEVFAENVLLLFEDSIFRNRIVDQARQAIRDKFDRKTVFPQFENLMTGMIRP